MRHAGFRPARTPVFWSEAPKVWHYQSAFRPSSQSMLFLPAVWYPAKMFLHTSAMKQTSHREACLLYLDCFSWLFVLKVKGPEMEVYSLSQVLPELMRWFVDVESKG